MDPTHPPVNPDDALINHMENKLRGPSPETSIKQRLKQLIQEYLTQLDLDNKQEEK